MTDQQTAHDTGLTTDEIASAGTTDRDVEGRAGTREDLRPEDEARGRPDDQAPGGEDRRSDDQAPGREYNGPEAQSQMQGQDTRPETTRGHMQAPAGGGEPAQSGGLGQDSVDSEPRAQLLEGEELQGVISRWKEIQANFVDEPRSAVQDADALVADLMQRLARMFAAERDQLESRWASGEDVSTEDLRQGLRRYRSFFERLLAA